MESDLRDALGRLAARDAGIAPYIGDDVEIEITVTVGDVRAARAALASPAPETRTAAPCSGCGKSISGPRFCLACVEKVDEPIAAPETSTGEGADLHWCETKECWLGGAKDRCPRCAPSPREGTP